MGTSFGNLIEAVSKTSGPRIFLVEIETRSGREITGDATTIRCFGGAETDFEEIEARELEVGALRFPGFLGEADISAILGGRHEFRGSCGRCGPSSATK